MNKWRRAVVASVCGVSAISGLGVAASGAAVSGSVVINEIHYNPGPGDDGDAEFFELHNPTGSAIDLTGFTVDDDESFLPGEMETLTLSGTIPAGGYVIIAPTGFDTLGRWGVAPIATMDFGLGGGGDTITLRDAAGTIIDEVIYDDDSPWTDLPDGNGPSLELTDAFLDNTLPSSWAPSIGGPTPGAANSVVGAAGPPDVVINELHYHPEDTGAEFVELVNNEPTVVDLSGFDLDGLIVFPAGTTVAPGGFLVITEDLDAFNATYPGIPAIEWTNGGLSNGGESVDLVSDTGVVVTEVDYDDEGDWPTTPDGNGPSLELIDPLLDESLPASWEPSAAAGGTPNNANDAVVCSGLAVTVDIGAGDVPTAGDDVILGTSGNDTIVGLGGDDVICGEDGDDVIMGNDGNDRIFGGLGDDVLSANAGDDVVVGGVGNDTAFTGSGDDQLFGGDGDDVLGSGSDADIVSGGDGEDRISGGSGADISVQGDDDDDAVNGGGGDDLLVEGNDGDDTVSGNGGNDVVNGNDGDDEVRGGGGDDSVFGDDGDDFVAGNGGDDLCDGGTGDETNGDIAASNCESIANIP